jgi:two-component system aerobic respiration control sensor histidine kinase ArcB
MDVGLKLLLNTKEFLCMTNMSNDSRYSELENFSNCMSKKSHELVNKNEFHLKCRDADDASTKIYNAKNSHDEKVILDNPEETYMGNKIPLFDHTGKCMGVLGISTDIAERQQMEEQLKITQQKTETLNQAKTEFITNMSHDVKTPLAGIIGMAELLTHQLNQKDCISYARNIQLAGQRLMVFFDNCLEIAKSQETDVTLAQERFSLRFLLEEVQQLFIPSIEHKDLRLNINFDDQLPEYVLGSRVGIYRILLNLIGNAIKFTESGYVIVNLKLGENSTPEKIILKIIVEDSGIGIAQNKQKVIFDQLSRLTPSYKKIYEGSGIGLYFVKKFVTTMDGEIYVHSAGEGKGSKFVIALPLRASLLKEHEYEEDFSEGMRNKSKKEPRILLVEDDHLSQIVATEYLKKAGYLVDLADCGEKALELFMPGKYNLIFMDIGLPGISGYEAARLIRAKEKHNNYSPRIKIIALTAHAASDVQRECDRFYINDIISKPLSMEKIHQFMLP